MQRFFVWLSGADTRILEKCVTMQESERRKLAGFGSLVLIPAFLGFLTMTFVASTFVSDWRICFGAGALWGLIVLAVDRFLTSTLYKSSEGGRRAFWFGLSYRLVFAGIIGFMVAEPLVLLTFSDSINQQLAEMKRSRKDTRLRAIGEMQQQAQGPFVLELSRLEESHDCLVRTLTAEQAGVKLTFTDHEGRVCGVSSGLPECRQRCENLKDQIRTLETRIAEVRDQFKQNAAGVAGATRNDVADIEADSTNDYLARSRALAALEQSEPRVHQTRLFLLVAFVFLDTLLILLKATTEPGEYEAVRDTLLHEIRLREAVKREVARLYAASGQVSTEHAIRQHQATKTELTGIMAAANEFLAEEEAQRLQFDAQIRAIARNVSSVKDTETQEIYVARLADIRDTFTIAWGKAMAKFNAYLRGL